VRPFTVKTHNVGQFASILSEEGKMIKPNQKHLLDEVRN
jgi:hypothetical protein